MTDNIHKRFPDGSWNVKCGKCDDRCSPFIREVIKEFPEHKSWLETWEITERKSDGFHAICHQCWKKDIVEVIEEYENKERKAKESQFKSSHCRYCNKSSLLYHYIYNSYSRKVESSFSNATNPNHQWVFCNQTCFNNCFPCKSCGRKKVEVIIGKGDNSTFFCSGGCLESYKEKVKKEKDSKIQSELDDLLRESQKIQESLDELNASTTCQECNKSGTIVRFPLIQLVNQIPIIRMETIIVKTIFLLAKHI